MSGYNCYYFCNDNSFGGSSYVSGTTCDGVVAAYTLNLNDCICMNLDYPIITCDSPIFSGSCFQYGCEYFSFSATDSIFSAFTGNYSLVRNTGGTYYTGGLTTLTSVCGSYSGDDYSLWSGTTINGQDCSMVFRQDYPLGFSIVRANDIPNTFYNCSTTTTLTGSSIGNARIEIGPSINGLIYPLAGTHNFVDIPSLNYTISYCGNITPNITPSTTPTPTITPTITSTPGLSPSPTPTITSTPTITPTRTATPTITPSATPISACPNEIIYTCNDGTCDDRTGSYTRTYTYSGGSFTFGYLTSSSGFVFFPDTLYLGNKYAVFTRTSGGFYYTMIFNASLNLWVVYKTTGDYIFNGGTFQTLSSWAGSVLSGDILLPAEFVSATFTISYPVSCPTPTPSNTPTITPTKTITPTPDLTPTITPTITNTPSITATIPGCQCYNLVNNEGTGGDYTYTQCGTSIPISDSLGAFSSIQICSEDLPLADPNISITPCGSSCLEDGDCTGCS